MWKRRKELREKIASIHAEMRQLVELSGKESRALTKEEDHKFAAMETDANQLHEELRKLDVLAEQEARMGNRPGRDTGEVSELSDGDLTDEQRAKMHNLAFRNYLRQGNQGLTPEQRKEFGQHVEERALGVSSFGVVGDRLSSNSLIDQMQHIAALRSAGATIITADTGNPFTMPISDDTGNEGEIVGEGVAVSGADPVVGVKTMGAHKYSSKVIRVAVELAQDANFDIWAYVSAIAARRIGKHFNRHSTVGDGVNKPTGLITDAGVSVPSAGAVLTYDDLLDLQGGLDASYDLATSAFMFHQSTMTALRKLKDNEGRPIWQPAFGGQPESVNGRRVAINNFIGQFSDGAATVVAAYGDMSKYHIRDVSGVIVARMVEKYIENGEWGFLVFSRHDGLLTDPSAIAKLVRS